MRCANFLYVFQGGPKTGRTRRRLGARPTLRCGSAPGRADGRSPGTDSLRFFGAAVAVHPYCTGDELGDR
jgi:hypothetical protein